MKMKSLRTGVAAAMGGAVLMAGLLVGASLALADDADQPEETDTTTQEETKGERHGFMKDRINRMAGGLEDLAGELGLSVEEIREQLHDGATLEEIAEDLGIDLAQAFADIREGALAEIDERVTAGDLTQEQADSIKDRIESFEPGEGPFGARPDRDVRGFGGFLGDLDVDLDGLRELIESGMTLEDAFEDLGVDVDALLGDALENATAHIDELVTDGHITQERADEMKERLESFELGEAFPFGARGFGHDGSRGPGGPGFFGDRDADANAEGALLDV